MTTTNKVFFRADTTTKNTIIYTAPITINFHISGVEIA